MAKRAIVLVLDSLGVGSTDDANKFGDKGANTLGHIEQYCRNSATREPLSIPTLTSFGLAEILRSASKEEFSLPEVAIDPYAAYGYAAPVSTGKDTISGHWEMMGAPVLFDWGLFQDRDNSFSSALLSKIYRSADIDGSIGHCHASGTEIINQLGQQHIDTGLPIFYTSADSVFQIAAHETYFGLDRLMALCGCVRRVLDDYNIGRVIARPFIGEAGCFKRTGNRRDFSVPPYKNTLLNELQITGNASVIGIGKISDIFAGSGIDRSVKAAGLAELFDKTLHEVKSASSDSLIFTNFVDFDSEFGHRRDIDGYAKALEYFDCRLPELLAVLREEDILIITADHGCDPTWPGSDHTRECVPIIAFGQNLQHGSLGYRRTFADIAETLAEYFHLPTLSYGTSFLQK